MLRARLDRHDNFDRVERIEAEILEHRVRHHLAFINLVHAPARARARSVSLRLVESRARAPPACLLVILDNHHDALHDVILGQEGLRARSARSPRCVLRARARVSRECRRGRQTHVRSELPNLARDGDADRAGRREWRGTSRHPESGAKHDEIFARMMEGAMRKIPRVVRRFLVSSFPCFENEQAPIIWLPYVKFGRRA